MKLTGKVAIVTGAGRGIGKAVALGLAREGANVVVNYITSLDAAQKVVEEIESLGRISLPIKADVSINDEVKKMVNLTFQKFGRIDILVNNAGILVPAVSPQILNLSEDAWDKTMNVNLKSVFLCSRAVFEIMMKQRSGKIINVASTMGEMGSLTGAVHYAASKGGVIAFTKTLAIEGATYGIKVNAVAAGPIETDLIKSISNQARETLSKHILLDRLGKPEDVAEVIVFLASDANYITGAIIPIHGGYMMRL